MPEPAEVAAEASSEKTLPAPPAAESPKSSDDNLRRVDETFDNNRELVIYTKRLAEYTGWLTVATVASVLVATIGVSVALWVAFSTKDLKVAAERQIDELQKSYKQLERSIEAANRQVTAATDANKISQQALNIATDTQHTQLRSYVSVYVERVDNKPNGNMNFIITAKNYGQTPALKFSQTGKAFILNSSSTIDQETADFFSTPAKGERILFQTETMSWPEILRMDDKEISGYNSGKKSILLFAAVKYVDIFSSEHLSSFCSIISIDKNIPYQMESSCGVKELGSLNVMR